MFIRLMQRRVKGEVGKVAEKPRRFFDAVKDQNISASKGFIEFFPSASWLLPLLQPPTVASRKSEQITIAIVRYNL